MKNAPALFVNDVLDMMYTKAPRIHFAGDTGWADMIPPPFTLNDLLQTMVASEKYLLSDELSGLPSTSAEQFTMALIAGRAELPRAPIWIEGYRGAALNYKRGDVGALIIPIAEGHRVRLNIFIRYRTDTIEDGAVVCLPSAEVDLESGVFSSPIARKEDENSPEGFLIAQVILLLSHTMLMLAREPEYVTAVKRTPSPRKYSNPGKNSFGYRSVTLSNKVYQPSGEGSSGHRQGLHLRSGCLRTYRHPRYRNMLGKTQAIAEYLAGSGPTKTIKTHTRVPIH